MLKRWFLLMSMLMLTSLMMTPLVVAAESTQNFRQKNGLLAYAPPVWFLEGYFIAREKNPGYIFEQCRISLGLWAAQPHG